jgi:hypothetical protein
VTPIYTQLTYLELVESVLGRIAVELGIERFRRRSAPPLGKPSSYPRGAWLFQVHQQRVEVCRSRVSDAELFVEGPELTDKQDAFENRLENELRLAVATLGLMEPIAFDHPKYLLEAVLIKLRSNGRNLVADYNRPLPDVLAFAFVVMDQDTGNEEVFHFDPLVGPLPREVAADIEAALLNKFSRDE